MDELVARLASGDVAALARACRVLDERAAGYDELSRALFFRAGNACVIGVTGAPGAGKSTLVDALIGELRGRGRVGVVAIDPSSPFSGGALLGDRIRMQRHWQDEGVFVRSLATRGARGGLSRSAFDVVNALDVWGAAFVLLETVGVGQAELDVLGLVETLVVVVVPGMGDDVQANKAGILEAADMFCLNKADRDGADRTEQELAASIALGAAESGFVPEIVRTVATRGEGVVELVRALDRHVSFTRDTPEGQARAGARARGNAAVLLRDLLADAILADVGAGIDALAAAVVERARDPESAVRELLSKLSHARKT